MEGDTSLERVERENEKGAYWEGNDLTKASLWRVARDGEQERVEEGMGMGRET